MTPQRLAYLQRGITDWQTFRGDWTTARVADAAVELLAYVQELTRQRDDARRIAIAAGAFGA